MGEFHGRYRHVSVCATDLDRARAFYGGRLGLKALRTRRMEATRR
jgi:catechol 2,3-dioxygenase-like lactoylglutathione lyase family enzyme